MARENKLLKTLKKPAPAAAGAADPQFDDFLAKIKQTDRAGEKNKGGRKKQERAEKKSEGCTAYALTVQSVLPV